MTKSPPGVDWVFLKDGTRKARARTLGQYLGLFDAWEQAEVAVEAFRAERAEKALATCRSLASAWFEARELSGIVRDISVDKSVWSSCVEMTCAQMRGPTWLDMDPQAVRTKHLQAWLEALATRSGMRLRRQKVNGEWVMSFEDTGRPLEYESIKKARSRVKLFFRWLKTKGKREGENPADGLIMPARRRYSRKGKQRIIHLVEEEIRALFALDLPLRTRAVFAIAIYAGLRPTELWGLRWEYVDFKARKFLIRETRTGDVKTPTSWRDVTMLPYAYEVVHAYWKSLHPRPLRGLVFPAKHGGCHGADYRARWDDKRQRRKGVLTVTRGWRHRAGIRDEVTFECFRHTCACQLLQGTVLGNAEPLDIYEVSTWLGHSEIGVTQRHYAEFAQDSVHNKALGIGKKKVARLETDLEMGK